MDLKVLRVASRADLVSCAAAVADNGAGLLSDAELMLTNCRNARAYALAALAIEEHGKAMGIFSLAFMPVRLRGRMKLDDLRDLLKDHAVKQMGGLILTTLQFGLAPGVTQRIRELPVDQLSRMLTATSTQAHDTGRMKERGLYAEMEADSHIWHPAQITETEATEQVDRARGVAASAAVFNDANVVAQFANPPSELLAIAEALFDQYDSGPPATSADAAAQAAKAGVDLALGRLAQGGA